MLGIWKIFGKLSQGKLLYYCPSLYNSLSLWERDLLDKSPGVDIMSSNTIHLSNSVKGVMTKSSSPLKTTNLGTENCMGQVRILETTVSESSPSLNPLLGASTLASSHRPSQSDSSSPTLSIYEANLNGCRESEIDDEALLAAFDSLIPPARENDPHIPIPVFLGKEIVSETPDGERASSSKPNTDGKGKEFAWSRGLGVEISPIKTRSSRKKLEGGLTLSEGKNSYHC
jgi:hypothetical protein